MSLSPTSKTPTARRLALLLAALVCTAAYVPAQSPDAVGGTWYASRSTSIVMRAGADSTASDLAVTSIVTLDLHVEGTTVSGEERQALSIPAEETTNRKDPVTVTTVREVTGTLEGDTLHLTMTTAYGPTLHYEGVLSPNGRHLTLRLVSQAAVRGAALPVPAGVPPITYGRQPPKVEPRKG